MRELAVNCIAVSILNAIEAPMLSFCAPQSHTATFGDQVKYCTDLVEENAVTGQVDDRVDMNSRGVVGGEIGNVSVANQAEWVQIQSVMDSGAARVRSSSRIG